MVVHTTLNRKGSDSVLQTRPTVPSDASSGVGAIADWRQYSALSGGSSWRDTSKCGVSSINCMMGWGALPFWNEQALHDRRPFSDSVGTASSWKGCNSLGRGQVLLAVKARLLGHHHRSAVNLLDP